MARSEQPDASATDTQLDMFGAPPAQNYDPDPESVRAELNGILARARVPPRLSPRIPAKSRSTAPSSHRWPTGCPTRKPSGCGASSRRSWLGWKLLERRRPGKLSPFPSPSELGPRLFPLARLRHDAGITFVARDAPCSHPCLPARRVPASAAAQPRNAGTPPTRRPWAPGNSRRRRCRWRRRRGRGSLRPSSRRWSRTPDRSGRSVRCRFRPCASTPWPRRRR